MKKSKFVTGLSAAFISAMALMSCSTSIRAKDGVILTIDGVPYTAEELFNDQKTPAAAEAKFNAVYKVAVRAYFTKEPGKSEMTEITNNTKIKISEQKATAQSNAATNGTSYAVEWQKILDSNGVEDEQGLYDKFEYELQKEKFENKFYDEHYKNLRNGEHFSDELTDVPFKNYLKAKQPYHIKHILIKLASAKAGDGVSAEISADEAHKISTVIRLLAEGNLSFEQISDLYNEDESAKANHGSLGIMSRDTSFVNDFKLGIYLYESFFSNSTKGETTQDSIYESINAKEELGLNTGVAGNYADMISKMKDPSGVTKSDAKLGLGLIPYEEALNLEKYKNDDFSKQSIVDRFSAAKLGKDDVAAKYYPRNVIFNKYFNKHNVMLITPNKQPALGEIINYVSGKKRIKADSYNGTFDSTKYASMPGFNYYNHDTKGVTTFAKNDDVLLDDIQIPNDEGTEGAPINTAKKVLRDNNGRTILVFHSGTGDSSSNDAYQGIHFVVIERSPFVTYEFDKTTDTGEDDPAYKTSRDDYYTEFWPGQSGGKHPTYTEGGNDWKKTYVNYIKDQDSKVLKERSDTVKSELKKCAPNLNTYLYQHLIKVGDVKFDENATAKAIEQNITDWIEITRTSQKIKDARSWDDTWQTYYYSLYAQEEQRKEVNVGSTEEPEIHSRLVPEICARAFSGEITQGVDLAELFGKGGVFHE